jgi:hypothetical protein
MMRKQYFFLLLLATILLLPSSLLAETSDPSGVVPCAVMAWSPEVFSFYGTRAVVAGKLASLDRDIMKHRTWAFLVESKDGAELTFFEVNADKSMVELSSMSGVSLQDLSGQISETLLRNDKRQCAGRLTKALIDGYSQGHDVRRASIQRPTTIGNAFQYAANDLQGEYMRATLILLC